jgi:hypothetical protein
MRVRRYVCPSGLELFRRPQYADADGNPVRISWFEQHAPWLVTVKEVALSEDRVARGRAARAAEAATRGLVPQCPRGHALPEGYLERPTVALGLVGLTGSGKTTLITSLVETLLSGALAPLGIAVTMDEESAGRFQVGLRRTLIQDRAQLPATVPAAGEEISDQPFVLRLSRARESINLLLYDASGEQLFRRRDIGEFNRYLYQTQAIMLVLSPSAFPGLEHLDDPSGADVGVAMATQMVTALADVVRQGRRVRQGEVVEEVAVAVVLAKADKLVGLNGFPQQHFRDLEGFIAYYPLAELLARVQDGSEEIVDFLQAERGQNLVKLMLDDLPLSTFHVVSATGHDVGADGYYPGIDQVGVVEPFVTLLARVGFLPDDGLAVP